MTLHFITHTQHVCLAIFCIFVVLQVSLDEGNQRANITTTTTTAQQKKHESNTPINADEVDACTFEELQLAFGPTNQTHIMNHLQNDTEKCWSLRDRILRVPASRIVNRAYMEKMGSGCLGGVYKAVLELPLPQLTASQYCAVALKTDNCYSIWDNPMPWKCEHSNAKSCLLDDPKTQWNYKTHMGGEYTGALPWYAQLETGQFQKGLLPTWGVVHDTTHPMKHWIPHAMTTSNPYPNPTLKGIIMPLLKFQPIHPPSVSLDPITAAQIMLPAAQGLAFLADMGLAVQDMASGNVGITEDPRTGHKHAIVYDYSYMGIDAHESTPCSSTTSLPSLFSQLQPPPLKSCQYCREATFPKAERSKMILPGSTAVKSDMGRFRTVIFQVLDRTTHPSLAQDFQDALNSCHTSHELVDALRNFLHRHYVLPLP